MDMKIIKYNYDTRTEYYKFIRKYNRSKFLNTLNIQTFSEGKTIYLVVDKGFFRKYKIIGYVIIYESLHVICFSNDISSKYDGDKDTIFIADFMIDYKYRNEGIGTELAKYIINFEYKDKNIILKPDGDGNWFWKKFGFINDRISQHMTWILKRNENIKVE